MRCPADRTRRPCPGPEPWSLDEPRSRQALLLVPVGVPVAVRRDAEDGDAGVIELGLHRLIAADGHRRRSRGGFAALGYRNRQRVHAGRGERVRQADCQSQPARGNRRRLRPVPVEEVDRGRVVAAGGTAAARDQRVAGGHGGPHLRGQGGRNDGELVFCT